MISDWTLKTYQTDTDLQPMLDCRDAIASKKFVTKKKDTVTKTSSSSIDLRQKLHQKKEKKVQDSEKELKLRDRSRSPMKRSLDDKGTRSSPGPSGSQMARWFQNSTINFSGNSNLSIQLSTK